MHTSSTDVKDKRLAQGDATRTALIRAARELFGSKGFAETSTDEVVARAGVTKGALYHHFRAKVTCSERRSRLCSARHQTPQLPRF